MIRTFIALEIPGPVQRQVSGVEDQLRTAGARVRWVKEENIHLTLKFLGDLSEERVEQLASGVSEAVQGFPPFEISLASLGAFPGTRSPRVVWIGVVEGEETVAELQKRIEERLSGLGFPKEGRKFSPHITIGRVKSRRGTEELVSKLKEISFSSEPFRVEGVTIFGSKLTPEGPIYTKLKEVGLSGHSAQI